MVVVFARVVEGFGRVNQNLHCIAPTSDAQQKVRA